MKSRTKESKNVNLLWTGGWDSTFQLLQLLLKYHSPVTPFYLIDAERPSTGMEILTMKRIKDHLFKKYPHTQKLLKPIQYYNRTDILADREITNVYQSIFKKNKLGIQYEWLSRLCKELEINNMQLSVEKSEFPLENQWDENLDQILSECIMNSQTVYRVNEKFKELDMYKIFQYFYFPLRKITKIQMSSISNKQGWNNIMHMTWFCHYPTCNKEPCGTCNPCLSVIKEGFDWRIPPKKRVKSIYYRRIIWPSKFYLKSILASVGISQ